LGPEKGKSSPKSQNWELPVLRFIIIIIISNMDFFLLALFIPLLKNFPKFPKLGMITKPDFVTPVSKNDLLALIWTPRKVTKPGFVTPV